MLGLQDHPTENSPFKFKYIITSRKYHSQRRKRPSPICTNRRSVRARLSDWDCEPPVTSSPARDDHLRTDVEVCRTPSWSSFISVATQLRTLPGISLRNASFTPPLMTSGVARPGTRVSERTPIDVGSERVEDVEVRFRVTANLLRGLNASMRDRAALTAIP